jgi:hypothetical protein
MAIRHFLQYLAIARIALDDYLVKQLESNLAEFRDEVALKCVVGVRGRSDLHDLDRQSH